MEIQILIAGTYSDFEVPGRPNKIGAKHLAAGDVVDYPDWYAESIVGSGLAKAYTEPGPLCEQLIDATRAAFRLAGELGIDLLTLTGSGAGGRITVGDVRKAAG